jgi:chromosome partitioning protein
MDLNGKRTSDSIEETSTEAVTITLANLKGGVTKTTTTLNMGMCARLLGKRVLIVDVDFQGNVTSAFGYESSQVPHTTYSLMLGESTFEDTVLPTYFDRNTRRFYDPTEKTFQRKQRTKPDQIVSGPDLLPCNVQASLAENTLLPIPNWGMLLRTILQQVRHRYDFIFIDTHPDVGKLTVNAFIASDFVIIPVVPEPWPTDGLIILSGSLVDAQKYHPALQVAGIFFARVRYTEHVSLMNYIRETLIQIINNQFTGLHLSCFGVHVNDNVSFLKSTNRRSCVVLSNPTDEVSLAYWAFFTEFLQKAQHPDFSLAYQQFLDVKAVHDQKEQRKADNALANSLVGGNDVEEQ